MMENQVAGKMKAPRILCEILAHGLTEDKPKMKAMFEKIQKQIAKSKVNKANVRILWYIDSGEKTIEEKKQWLIEEANCVFYVFAPENHKVPDSYVQDIMRGVNLFDRSLALMREQGVKMKKKGQQIVEEEQASQPLLEPLE